MEDNTKIFLLFCFVLLVFLMIGLKTNAQTVLEDKTFNKAESGVAVVEFWEDWNKRNQCDWIDNINGGDIYRIDLNTKTAEKYDIKVLPTILVLENGKEIKRFEGDISFKLCPKRTPKKVQKAVDGLMINKF